MPRNLRLISMSKDMLKECIGFLELFSPVKNSIPIDNSKFEMRIFAYASAHFVYFGNGQRI